MLANERRDHNGAFTSSKNAGVLIITERLGFTVYRIIDHRAADMDGRIFLCLQQSDVSHSAIHAAGYLHILLHIEEAGV